MKYITHAECKVGMEVIDKTYGNGTIKEVLKTRVKVKFETRPDLVTYDTPHIKICLQIN